MRKHERRILIIEDEEDIVTFLMALLAKDGRIIDSALDGEIGINKAFDTMPDLVILDIQLPKKNGFAVFKYIKATKELKYTKIMMLTSLNRRLDYEISKSEMAALFGAEPDAYFSKPILNPEALKEQVTMLLGDDDEK